MRARAELHDAIVDTVADLDKSAGDRRLINMQAGDDWQRIESTFTAFEEVVEDDIPG